VSRLQGRAQFFSLKVVLRFAAYTQYPEQRIVLSYVTTPEELDDQQSLSI